MTDHTDLTARLRQHKVTQLADPRLLAQAADRIEALEAERDRLSVEIDRQISVTVDALAERDAALADVARLREALRRACNDAWSDGEGAMAHYLADTEEATDA